MPSKKKSQASHAKRRVYSRYGLTLNRYQFKELCDLLSNGHGETLCKQSLTRSIRRIKYIDTDFFVVWDKKRQQVATFLTKEMAEQHIDSKGKNDTKLCLI